MMPRGRNASVLVVDDATGRVRLQRAAQAGEARIAKAPEDTRRRAVEAADRFMRDGRKPEDYESASRALCVPDSAAPSRI
jgi:hypothetical protein